MGRRNVLWGALIGGGAGTAVGVGIAVGGNYNPDYSTGQVAAIFGILLGAGWSRHRGGPSDMPRRMSMFFIEHLRPREPRGPIEKHEARRGNDHICEKRFRT